MYSESPQRTANYAYRQKVWDDALLGDVDDALANANTEFLQKFVGETIEGVVEYANMCSELDAADSAVCYGPPSALWTCLGKVAKIWPMIYQCQHPNDFRDFTAVQPTRMLPSLTLRRRKNR
uniref:Uncharacterized protein n=1 Tax=Plectus sambesii TaxID=2011161 RepID=A0A914W0F3_9BILA